MKIAALLSGLIVAAMAVSGCVISEDRGQQSFDAGVAAYEREHYEAALLDLEPRAIAGDRNAQFYMYQIYSDRNYSGRNPEEADRWLQEAAKSNHPDTITMQLELAIQLEVAIQQRLITMKQEEEKKRKDFETVLHDCGNIKFEYKHNEENKEVEDIIKSCLDRYKKHADSGNYEASRAFGTLCLFVSTHEDLSRFCTVSDILKYLEFAVAKDDTIAAFQLAEFYNSVRSKMDISARQLAERYNNDINKDALDFIEKIEKTNNLVRQYFSNRIKEEASKYYRSAASEDHPGARLRLAEFALENEEYEKAFQNLLRVANRGPDQLSRYTDGKGTGDFVYDARAVVGHLFSGNKEISLVPFDKKLDGEKLREKLHVSEDKIEAYVWYKLAQWDDATINDELGTLMDEDKNIAEERVRNWQEKYLEEYGSGFYVERNLIMTNWHVVSEDSKVCDEIRAPFRQTELLVKDETADLAILRVEGEVNRGIAVRRQGDPDITEEVVAFGYPHPRKASVQGNFTSGIVSGIRDPYTVFRLYDDIKERSGMIMHTAPISGGNSGGPLLDKYGRVIGVNTEVEIQGSNIPPQNINYAMGYERINAVLFKAYIALKASEKIDMLLKKRNSTENEPKSMKELYNLAKAMTVRIECWRNRN